MQRRTCTLVLAVVFVCLFSSRAHAQKAAWDIGWPKPGAAAGTIDVQGTSTASPGSKLTGTGSATVWVKGGGEVKVQACVTVNAATGDWSGTITGLASGTTYNIEIAIFQQDAAKVQSAISPDPRVSKAK
jgi:hypothetical protein